MARLAVDVDVAVNGASKLNSLAGGFAKGAIAVAKVGVPIAGAVAGLTALAAEAEKSDARLAQTFKTMKAGAFTTIPALNKQADALGQLSEFDDEGIKDAQATLLTFGNVTGKSFDQGLQAAVDMASFLGTDLQSATIQMGKALNDPVKGITALSRAGVSFTEEQTEMIKTLVETGDAAGAQNIILAEMQKQFGGAAEAMSETAAGETAQAFEDLTNAGEEIGAIFLPILASLAKGVSGFAHFVQDNFPTIKAVIGTVMEGIGVAFAFIADEIIPRVIGAFQGVGNSTGGFATIVNFIAKNVIPFLVSAFQSVIGFLQENWPTISSIFQQVFGAVANVVKVVGPIILGLATVIFPAVLTAAGVLLRGLDVAFKTIGGIFEVVGNVVKTVVQSITASWQLLLQLTTFIWEGITGVIKGVVNGIIDILNGFFGFLNNLQIGIPQISIPNPFGGGPLVQAGGGTIDPFNIPLIPHLAEGGIIDSPTLALIGERGREAVVPLDQAGKLGGDFHSHITVQGELPFIRSEDDLVRVQQRIAFLEGF